MPDDPQPLEPLNPDALRIGPYQILGELGAGGMGSVYLAQVRADANLVGPFGDLPPPGTRVAVKAFHPHLVNAGDFEGRFRREARIGAAIQHENLVRTLDAGVAQLRGHETSYMAAARRNLLSRFIQMTVEQPSQPNGSIMTSRIA